MPTIRQLDRSITFKDPQTIKQLSPEKIQALNKTVQTPGDDVVVQDAAGKTHVFSVDEFLKQDHALAHQKGFLSVTRRGVTVVIDLDKLNKKSLQAALQKVNTQLQTPQQLSALVDAAQPLLAQIRSPQRVQNVSQLSQPTLSEFQGVVQQFQQINQQLEHKTSLSTEILGLRSRLQFLRTRGPAEVEINGQQVPKQRAIQHFENILAEKTQALNALPADLDAQQQAAIQRLLPPQGVDVAPVLSRAQRLTSQIQTQQHALSPLLSAIDLAETNGQNQVTFQGQTLSLQEAKAALLADPRYQRLQTLTQELNQLIAPLNQALDAMSADQRSLFMQTYDAGGAVLKSTTEFLSNTWAAFQSKGGFSGLPVPAIPIWSKEDFFVQDVKDTGHNILGYLGTISDFADVAKMVRYLPDGLKTKLAEALGKISAKLGPEKFRQFLTTLGQKFAAQFKDGAVGDQVLSGIGFLTDAYGGGYYTGIATGAIYPNVEINGSIYEIRPSAWTKRFAAAAGGANLASAFGTVAGGPLGRVGASVVLGFADLVFETGTEFFLLQDQEKLEDVIHNIVDAETGPELRQGLENLRSKYGEGPNRSLSGIQDVLGQVEVHEGTNTIAKVSDDNSDVIDRQFSGVVLSKLVRFAKEGKITNTEARQAISELLQGLGSRMLSDDDVAQSFLNQLLVSFPSAEDQSFAFQMLGPDVRMKLVDMLNGGVTTRHNLNWVGMDESERDQPEMALIRRLAMAETDPGRKGKIISTLLSGITADRNMGLGVDFASADQKSKLAYELILGVRGSSPLTAINRDRLKTLLSEIKVDGQKNLNLLSYGLQNDEAGKVLAWMVEAGYGAGDIQSYIQSFSSSVTGLAYENWFANDNITVGFLNELESLNISIESINDKGLIDQTMLKTLFDNLENGVTSNGEYDLLERLAKVATPQTRIYMINQLMGGVTDSRAEQALVKVLAQASDAEKRSVINGLDLSRLGSELNRAEDAAEVMNKLVQLFPNVDALNTKLTQFFDGVQNQNYFKALATSDDDTAYEFLKNLGDATLARLDDALLMKMYDSLYSGSTIPSEYDQIERIFGHVSPANKVKILSPLLKGVTFARAETAIKNMIQQLSAEDQRYIARHIDFKTLGEVIENPKEAAEIMNKIVSLGLPANELKAPLNQFFDGILNQAYFVDTTSDDAAYHFVNGLSDTALANLDDDLRRKLFVAMDNGTTGTEEYKMMRKVMKGASVDLKAELIKMKLDADTYTSDEKLVFHILQDTPYANNEFLSLVQKLDTAQLASEIETDSDAGIIAKYIARAYHDAGQVPLGDKLDHFLEKLAESHRPAALQAFMNDSEIMANTKAIYREIKPQTIIDMANLLMAGDTNSAEETAIYDLIRHTSWNQFSDVISSSTFRADLQSELGTSQWNDVQNWYWELPRHL